MEVRYLPAFLRMYRKLSPFLKERVHAAIVLFMRDPFDVRLRNHKLSGSKRDVHSISAGYDLRILYKEQGGHRIVLMIAVGRHEDVY